MSHRIAVSDADIDVEGSTEELSYEVLGASRSGDIFTLPDDQGTVVFDGDGVYTYSPGSNNSPVRFTIRVRDKAGLSSDAHVEIGVRSGKDPVDQVAALNPGDAGSNVVLSNDNTHFAGPLGRQGVRADLGADSGKWYFEIKGGSYHNLAVGWGLASANIETDGDLGTGNDSFRMRIGYSENTGPSIFNYDGLNLDLPGINGNDTLGVAFDVDTGDLTFYRNGSVHYQSQIDVSGGQTWYPILKDENGHGSMHGTIVFDEASWAHGAPEGYQALTSHHLADIDLLDLAGTDGDDLIEAGGKSVTVDGGAGDDVLKAGTGQDYVSVTLQGNRDSAVASTNNISNSSNLSSTGAIFTLEGGTDLDQISLSLRNGSDLAVGNLVVKLYTADSNGWPGTLVATSEQVGLGGLGQDFADVAFRFGAETDALGAGQYVFQLENSGADDVIYERNDNLDTVVTKKSGSYLREDGTILFSLQRRDLVSDAPVTLLGGTGDDSLFGGLGDDHLDGGEGTDVVTYAGNKSDYMIHQNADGTLSVTDLNADGGDDGVDLLTGIEKIVFADQTLEIDASNTGPEALDAKLVVASGDSYDHILSGSDADGGVLTYELVGANSEHKLVTDAGILYLVDETGSAVESNTTGAYRFEATGQGTASVRWRVTDDTDLSSEAVVAVGVDTWMETTPLLWDGEGVSWGTAPSLSEGGSKLEFGSSLGGVAGTLSIPGSGKWALRFTLGEVNGPIGPRFGIAVASDGTAQSGDIYGSTPSFSTAVLYESNENIIRTRFSGGEDANAYNGANDVSAGDQIEYLIDRDAGTVVIKRNGVALGDVINGLPSGDLFVVATGQSTSLTVENDYVASDPSYQAVSETQVLAPDWPVFDEVGNPASSTGTVSNELTVTSGASWGSHQIDMEVPSTGKWSWQVTLNGGAENYYMLGLYGDGVANMTHLFGQGSDRPDHNAYLEVGAGWLQKDGATQGSQVPVASANDVIELLFDADNRTLTFKNQTTGATLGTIENIDPAVNRPFVSVYNSSATVDFGQNGYQPSDSAYQSLNSLSGVDLLTSDEGTDGNDVLVERPHYRSGFFSDASDVSDSTIDGGAGDDYLKSGNLGLFDGLIVDPVNPNEFPDNTAPSLQYAVTTLLGGVGNDTLVGNTGNDHLDGGEGQDIAVFAGNRADYTISKNADGTLTVTDLTETRAGLGVDVVRDVEKLSFDDQTLEIDASNTGPEALDAKLVVASGDSYDHILSGSDADGGVLTYELVGANSEHKLVTDAGILYLVDETGSAVESNTTGAYRFEATGQGTASIRWRVTDDTDLSSEAVMAVGVDTWMETTPLLWDGEGVSWGTAPSLSEGGSKLEFGSSLGGVAGTLSIPGSGKWALRFTLGEVNGPIGPRFGIAVASDGTAQSGDIYGSTPSFSTAVLYESNENIIRTRFSGGEDANAYNGANDVSAGDQIEYLIDRDAGTVVIKRNGVALGDVINGLPSGDLFVVATGQSTSLTVENDYVASDPSYQAVSETQVLAPDWPVFDEVGNPASSTGTVSNELTVTSGASWGSHQIDMEVPSTGKWSWQVTLNGGAENYYMLGLYGDGVANMTHLFGQGSDRPDHNAYLEVGAGWLQKDGATQGSQVPVASANDVIELLFDADNRALTFKNQTTGATLGTIENIDPAVNRPFVSVYNSSATVDFGQNGYQPSDSAYQSLNRPVRC